MQDLEIMNTKNPTKSVLSKDEITLHLIASGVIRLAQVAEDRKPLTLPYPRPLQNGLDPAPRLCPCLPQLLPHTQQADKSHV